MATVTVTTANYNSAAFWASVDLSGGGHTLDFSALPAGYGVVWNADGTLQIWNGTAWYTVGSAGATGTSATLGGTTSLTQFDQVTGTAAGDDLASDTAGSADILSGGGGADILDGEAGHDSLFGGDANDTLHGGEGHDHLDGDAGLDWLYGGAGDDTLVGDAGNDRFFGGTGDDQMSDSSGNNTFHGEDGNDLIQSSTGADLIFGGADNDSVLADGGSDEISGGTGDDRLDAGAGDDEVTGDAGHDTIWGKAGADIIIAGAGNDSVYGGDDYDLIFFNDTDGSDVIFGGEGGTDWDELWLWSDTVAAGVTVIYTADESGTIDFAGTDAFATFAEIELIAGTQYNDTLDADATSVSEMEMLGQDGDDTIYGGQGLDYIYGGTGNDTVIDGSGDDITDLGEGDDTHGGWSANGDGNDQVFGGTGQDSIIGGAGDDELYGDADNDTISGGAGADLLYGGSGADQFAITDDHEYDSIEGGDSAGDVDLIWFATYATTAGVTVTFTGDEAGSYAYADQPFGYLPGTGDFIQIEAIGGTDYDDLFDASVTLTAKTLYAQAGNDSVAGGAGDDEIHGGDGTDTIGGGGGHDVIHTGTGADEVGGDDGNDTIINDDGYDVISGGSGDDSIQGAGQIFGDAGHDTIDFTFAGVEFQPNIADGGEGNDTVIGGDATDDVIYLSTGTDTVTGGANTGYGDWLYGDNMAAGITASMVTGIATSGADTTTFSGIEGITGSAHDDSFTGDSGTNEFYGNAGNDTINAGSGADSVWGGDDADTLHGTAGDRIEGGEGGTDNDVLILRLSDVDSITYSGGDNESGTVTFTAASGGGTLTFFEIENLYLVDEPAAPPDHTVEGTSGDDLIDAAYTGDPEGDRIDAADALDGSHDDLVHAGAGQDRVFAGDGIDTVLGEAGADSLYGDAAGDSLYGGGDNDVLDGGEGHDLLSGDAGDDLIIGAAGQDSIDGGSGHDAIYGGDDADTVTGGLDNDTLSGNAGADWLDGADGNDTAYGDTGNDSLIGGLGNDSLYGGADADQIAGDAGQDDIGGGDGDDLITGGAGDDAIGGDTGNDSIAGDAGADEMYGALGQDTLDGGADNDQVFGEIGNDTVSGGAGDDTVYGGWDDDKVYGGDDTDLAAGRAGNDTVWGGAGNDRVIGGADSFTQTATSSSGSLDTGAQTLLSGEVMAGYHVGNGADANESHTHTFASDPLGARLRILHLDPTERLAIWMNGAQVDLNTAIAQGWVTIAPGNTPYVINAAGEIATAAQAPVPTDPFVLTISRGMDSLTVQNLSASGAGGGTIYDLQPLSDDDTLYGETGEDSMSGGMGADQIFGGEGADSLSGGEGNDTLTGNDGNDTLDGGTGDDTLAGSAGDDLLFGDAGRDTLFGDADHDRLSGGADTDTLYGGGGNDTLYGDAGDDRLEAGQGDDLIYGGTGDDFALGNDGNDSFEGYLGTDTLLGGQGNDRIDGAEDRDTLYGGDNDDLLLGGDADDSLSGDAGHDTLQAGDGNDRLDGGTGSDSMAGGAGDDSFVLTDGFGTDTIEGSETGETTGDSLDASALTGDVVLDLSALDPGNPEDGTLTAGADTATFIEIESITLGSGDDSIIGSSGSDSVAGGLGADTFDGGAGNDRFDLGTGTDTDRIVLDDGDGDDVILGFGAPIDNGDGTFTGQDQIDVGGLTDAQGNPVNVWDVTVTDDGAGNAVLGFPNGESLTLIGVSPASLSDPKALIALGIPASDGTVSGTTGDDVIDATYLGDADGDRVDAADNLGTGAANDDIIAAGAGADLVTGGIGRDTIDGGTGNDTITVAQGDSALGGDGDDLFLLEDLAEAGTTGITITGGEGDETTGDTLDLGTLADLSTLTITNTGAGGLSGTVLLDDGTLLTFSEIENIICFTPGTRIATPRGARPIETLVVGDLVVTRDHGLRPIRWIGQRRVPAIGRLAPVRIRPGVVTGLERDLLVSPQHRMLFQGYRAELLFGDSEVLVAATHLVDGRAVTQEPGGMVTYIHLLFDTHEIIYAEGAATESFHPGEAGLPGIEAAAREELFGLFPELRAMPAAFGRAARRSLKRHEAQLIRR